MPYRGELMGNSDDSLAAWVNRPSGVYWYQPTTKANGFVLHMRRENLKSDAIANGQVCQIFVNVLTGTATCRSADWKAGAFSDWK